MSAFRGNADIEVKGFYFRFDPKRTWAGPFPVRV